MKKVYIAIAVAILMLSFTSIAMAATEQDAQEGMAFLKVMFGGLLIAGLGIASSRKGKIVLFANYTDIAYTSGVVFIPLIIGIILAIMIGDKVSDGRYILYFSLAIGSIMSLVVLKATYMYNRGYKHKIRAFLLAYIAKIFMLIFFVIALIWALSVATDRKKRGYESDSEHQLKTTARGIVGIAAASGIFLFLSKLGLSRPGFVSFKEYLNGQQQPEFNEEQAHTGGGF